MSVEDSIAAFARVCQEVYPLEDMDAISRSTKLRNALASILDEQNVEPSVLLSQAGGTNICLGYSSTSSMATWRAFRNYPIHQYSYDPSLIDAICACWATAGLFQSVIVGNEAERNEIVSAEATYPNPAVQAIQEASQLYGLDRHVGLLLSLGSGVSSRLVPGAKENLLQIETTSRELERRLGTTGIYSRLSVVPSLAVATEMSEEIIGIFCAHTSDYLQHPVTDRLLDQMVRTRDRGSRFTLKGISETTAPPKVSMAGLPPLSPYFVQREVPMNHMDVALLGSEEEMRQRVSIITGMGGSGKTQIVIAWARLHAERFQHILFIDASSEKSVETDLVTRLKCADRSFQGSDLNSAVQALAEPNEVLTAYWCLILDNADDPDLDIGSLLPACDHGTIIITSRNAQLESISPKDHFKLASMTKDEACHALLTSALAPTGRPTLYQRELAMAIVEEFEYLPIAVIQAGCYIRKHQCLDTYLNRLTTSRPMLLKLTTAQRDKLRYKHSVYAAFDTTLSSLSERALGLLSILCFFHYTGFPRSVISLAGSKDFLHEEYKLMDRGPDFEESINLLRQLMVPNEKFEELELDLIIEELQQSSLITIVSIYSDNHLRFHPLLHAWAYDRQSDEERRRNKAAALRLLTCVVDDNDGVDIERQLFSHARHFIAEINSLHVNDRGALAELLEPGDTSERYVAIWEGVYQTVRAAYGDLDLRSSGALLHLAEAQIGVYNYKRMEQLSRTVLDTRLSLGEPRTAFTARAMCSVAQSLDLQDTRLEEIVDLFRTAYEIRREVLGSTHIDTQRSMLCLAENLIKGRRGYDEACIILEKIMDIRTKLYGSLHAWTLETTKALLDCYADMDEKKEQLNNLLETCSKIDTNTRVGDTSILAFQAHVYELQGKYQQAERAYWELLEAGSQLYGHLSARNLATVLKLAYLLRKLDKKAELESLLRQYAKIGEGLKGSGQYELVFIMRMLGSCLISQRRYDEARAILSAALEKVIERFGRLHSFTTDTRERLAYCYYHQGDYSHAESLFRENVSNSKEALGREDASQISSLLCVARCVYEQKRYEESEELWHDVYLRRKATLGPNHPAVCTDLCWVVQCLQMRGLYHLAVPPIAEVMEIHRTMDGGDKGEIVTAHRRVAEVLARQEMLDEAEEAFRTHIKLAKELHRGAGREYALELGNLAKFLFDRGRYEESKIIREDQLRLWKELQNKEEQEFIAQKLQQIEVALQSHLSVNA
ncbi:SubName: Full=Uncharacterized protein {ECO:0000313/EMBL:CCA73429.1} [Serendipita indica DSM 11827]|nr:SubName: Full=Uncharacterized protein {ECO:0000313/EMBL:CCA73429.1} [Serendipita indica DSM 11827]